MATTKARNLATTAAAKESSPSLGLRFVLPSDLAASARRNDRTMAQQQQLLPQQEHEPTKPAPVAVMPVIVLDLERLVGYQPESSEEIATIKSQLLTTMWTRYRQIREEKRRAASPEEKKGANGGGQEQQEDDNEDDVLPPPGQQQIQPPPDFDEQIVELFRAKVARFEESPAPEEIMAESSTTIPRSRLVIPYPPKLLRTTSTTDSISRQQQSYLDTAQLWKEIDWLAEAVPSQSPSNDDDSNDKEKNHGDGAANMFLVRLTKHLKATGQPLLWKHAMAVELISMARSEQERLEHDEWTTTKRETSLHHLYSVRETLVHQYELARHSYETLHKDRESQVQQDVLRHEAMERSRKSRQIGRGWSDGSDNVVDDDPYLNDGFGTSDLSFPEEFQLLGITSSKMHEEEEGDEDDWRTDDYSSSDSSASQIDDDDGDDEDGSLYNASGGGGGGGGTADDEHEDDDKDTSDNANVTATMVDGDQKESLPVAFPDAPNDPKKDAEEFTSTNNGDPSTRLSTPFQRRQERRRCAKHRKRQERQEVERRAQLERRKELEEQLRAKYTSNELILAETLFKAMETKVQSVDDLLESLQDEVWEAQEEEEGKDGKSGDGPSSKTNVDDSSSPVVSLLDQVLAMILGELPKEPGKTQEEHYTFVKREHTAIVDGWKNHFGRLPLPIGYDGDQAEEAFPSPPKPPVSEKLSAEEQRNALGIVDNDQDEWDAESDSDDDAVAQKTIHPQGQDVGPTAPSAPPTQKSPRVGLRPGGRVRP